MGGSLIAISDNDLSLAQTTPSLLNNKMNNELVFSFSDYLGAYTLELGTNVFTFATPSTSSEWTYLTLQKDENNIFASDLVLATANKILKY